MSWLTGRLSLYLAGALAVILALSLGVTTLRRHRAQKATAEAYQARDKALADYDRCKVNRITLTEATQRQNEAVEAVRKLGDAKVAAATKALSEAARGRAGAEARVARLMRPPVGIDACARMESADRAVLGTIR